MATTTAFLLAKRFTQAQLEAKLDQILTEELDGKTLAGWNSGDSAAQKHIWLSMPPNIREDDVAQALTILDPVTYPPVDIVPISQTKVKFSNPFNPYGPGSF